MRKFARSDEEAEVNMTPMLDIVFIMLIFFIVTASFVKESGLELNKPDSSPNDNSPPPPEELRAIAFVIDESNRITHDNRVVDLSSVPAIIKQESVERPKANVVIQASEGAFIGNVIEMYDDAIEVGISREKIVVVPKK